MKKEEKAVLVALGAVLALFAVGARGGKKKAMKRTEKAKADVAL